MKIDRNIKGLEYITLPNGDIAILGELRLTAEIVGDRMVITGTRRVYTPEPKGDKVLISAQAEIKH